VRSSPDGKGNQSSSRSLPYQKTGRPFVDLSIPPAAGNLFEQIRLVLDNTREQWLKLEPSCEMAPLWCAEIPFGGF
jgi:hypothetical protein